MSSGITFNGRTLDDLVWQVLSIDGHMAPQVAAVEHVEIPDTPPVFGSSLRVEARQITVRLDVRPNTIVDRARTIDRLTRRLAGLLEVATIDAPDRVMYAVLRQVGVELYTGAHANPICMVVLTLDAADGTRWEALPVGFAIGAAGTQCPLGTAPSLPKVVIAGACTDPEVVMHDAAGMELARLRLSGTLGTDDTIEIDCQAETIELYVAGVLQAGVGSGLSWYVSGAFPLLSPEDGRPEAGVWPRVSLEAASGTPAGYIMYRRGY